MTGEMLKERKIPPLWQEQGRLLTVSEWEQERGRLLERLRRECYGAEPVGNWQVSGEPVERPWEDMGGKAVRSRWMVRICDPATAGSQIGIPVTMLMPKCSGKAPVFLWIQFEAEQDKGIKPLEEIIDNGYGVVSCYYQDIARDGAETEDCPKLMRTTKTNSWGAIAKWAFGLSRIMDFLLTREDIDGERVAVVGGSRLGKTVLWAGAIDQRFSLCVPMMSGTGGVSLYRGNTKETLDQVLHNFPHWFCRNFQEYTGKVDQLFFDAHFLLALRAPGFTYVCCGSQDPYVDVQGQFLACCAANPAYRIFGAEGLAVQEDGDWPEDFAVLQEGRIGYHVRPGGHFMSRYDFEQVMKYRKRYHI